MPEYSHQLYQQMISTSPPCDNRKFGDIRADGYRFQRIGNDGHECWISPAAQLRDRFSTVFHHARKRADRQGVPFSVTIEYLQGIFPEDGLCPVFSTPIIFGGGVSGRDNSPSLDRLFPHLGYVPGNLRWISNRANTIKRDATLSELEAVVSYLKTNI